MVNIRTTLTAADIEALGFVPYTGASADVDLGAYDLTCNVLNYTTLNPPISFTGYVQYTGTPVNNQLAIFTNGTTVEGDADLTWDGATFIVKRDVLYVDSGHAYVGIGASAADSSAALEVISTTKGFLPPRMTGNQAVAISSPTEGLMVYATAAAGEGDITGKGWWGYNGSNWIQLG